MHWNDPLEAASPYRAEDASWAAIQIARRWIGADPDELDVDLLRELGALRSDGYLTRAGALTFVAQESSLIELTVFDVPGGDVLNFVGAAQGTSLLEQFIQIDAALRMVNDQSTIVRGSVHHYVRQVPEQAAREAVLNGIIHRDWNRHEPTSLQWFDLDSTLVVRSPGGFVGEITSHNVLSNREARNPSLADLFRALGMVEKQGVGVDRMYQAMITLGHRPPVIEEVAGPHIECTLRGGRPRYPVVGLVDKFVPAARGKDVRLAVILYELLHHPFVTLRSVSRALQASEQAGRVALEVAEQTAVEGEPFISPYKSVWMLGAPARRIVQLGTFDPRLTVLQWLDELPSITSSDLAQLLDISGPTARRKLLDLVAEGVLIEEGQGRSTRFCLALSTQ